MPVRTNSPQRVRNIVLKTVIPGLNQFGYGGFLLFDAFGDPAGGLKPFLKKGFKNPKKLY